MMRLPWTNGVTPSPREEFCKAVAIQSHATRCCAHERACADPPRVLSVEIFSDVIARVMIVTPQVVFVCRSYN
jgi:hypothetical protein